MGSCSGRIVEAIRLISMMARTLPKMTQILIPLLAMATSTYATGDGANWEVHPETGCVQFKYCPPTPSCGPTVAPTTTTTTPITNPKYAVAAVGAGGDPYLHFFSLS